MKKAFVIKFECAQTLKVALRALVGLKSGSTGPVQQRAVSGFKPNRQLAAAKRFHHSRVIAELPQRLAVMSDAVGTPVCFGHHDGDPLPRNPTQGRASEHYRPVKLKMGAQRPRVE